MNEPAMQPASPAPSKKNKSFTAGLFDYVEMFAWAVFIVMILFTFGFRICQVKMQSMEDTLHEGDRLLLCSSFYTPKQDDIIVFHVPTNKEKTIIKRVIALGGQEVVIDINAKTITVDGVEYADSHRYLKDYNDQYNPGYFDGRLKDGVFRATVPDGYVFVMGDNRNHSNDSRTGIGFVDQNSILGVVVLRLSPFTFF